MIRSGWIWSLETGLYSRVENIRPVPAGFPSPSQDFMDLAIDLNKELVRHPASTFYDRVHGDSMLNAGVSDGDILIIDKSLEPHNGDMAVCFLMRKTVINTSD